MPLSTLAYIMFFLLLELSSWIPVYIFAILISLLHILLFCSFILSVYHGNLCLAVTVLVIQVHVCLTLEVA